MARCCFSQLPADLGFLSPPPSPKKKALAPIPAKLVRARIRVRGGYRADGCLRSVCLGCRLRKGTVAKGYYARKLLQGRIKFNAFAALTNTVSSASHSGGRSLARGSVKMPITSLCLAIVCRHRLDLLSLPCHQSIDLQTHTIIPLTAFRCPHRYRQYYAFLPRFISEQQTLTATMFVISPRLMRSK